MLTGAAGLLLPVAVGTSITVSGTVLVLTGAKPTAVPSSVTGALVVGAVTLPGMLLTPATVGCPTGATVGTVALLTGVEATTGEGALPEA
mgnify:CR=1 FL=1